MIKTTNGHELTRSEIPKCFFQDVRTILADALKEPMLPSISLWWKPTGKSAGAL